MIQRHFLYTSHSFFFFANFVIINYYLIFAWNLKSIHSQITINYKKLENLFLSLTLSLTEKFWPKSCSNREQTSSCINYFWNFSSTLFLFIASANKANKGHSLFNVGLQINDTWKDTNKKDSLAFLLLLLLHFHLYFVLLPIKYCFFQ